jgi:predicted O-methyltransferase YrrM
MNFRKVATALHGIPYTGTERGRRLYEFILKNQPKRCLELGFAHGVSSCYMAAALQEVDGHLVAVDLEAQRDAPLIEHLLRELGLEDRVTVVRERSSYTWFLRKAIEEHSSSGVCVPSVDFCFIDGAKNWTIDGAAFFLVDKLLRPEGWILFDDYDWSYARYERSTGRTSTDGLQHASLGLDELQQSHVALIFKLLVMQHPSYSNFVIEDDRWAWAQKTSKEVKQFRLDTHFSLRARLLSGVRTLTRLLRRPRATRGTTVPEDALPAPACTVHERTERC